MTPANRILSLARHRRQPIFTIRRILPRGGRRNQVQARLQQRVTGNVGPENYHHRDAKAGRGRGQWFAPVFSS